MLYASHRFMWRLLAAIAVVACLTSLAEAVRVLIAESPAQRSPAVMVALFVAFAGGCAVAAWGLWQRKTWAWALAVLLVSVTLFPAAGEAGMWALIILGMLATVDPRLTLRRRAAEQDLQRVAAALAVPDFEHVAGQIDALLENGDTGKAAALYRDAAGVSWDRAYIAVANWQGGAVEQKLRLLAHHLEQRPARQDAQVAVQS